MAKSDSFEVDLLNIILRNISGGAFAVLSQNTATVGGVCYVSLHTADPGEAGTQSTSEISYGGTTPYARQPIARETGWNAPFSTTAPFTAVSNNAIITFPTAPLATNIAVTHFGIGTAASGTGLLLYSGTISVNGGAGPGTRTITEGIAATFAAGTLIIGED